ncbi:MAG TPA: isoprenylcysteine carboxylmethyltransferase family protein, partial [Saprospiraceae bacterium]|nr:isoprenylcysteine carboxylmethyltransferase family protein [Saprospiraceae bacterium]
MIESIQQQGAAWGLGTYLLLLLLYHGGEYYFAWKHHGNRSVDALLITWPYVIAQSLCLLEYVLEWHYFPEWKTAYYPAWWLIGLGGCATGLFIRFLAIRTAHQAFTHQIQTYKRTEHHLVRHGIYKWSRHPGYFGWLLWAVSVPILLKNPISLLLFAVWSWRFFSRRIPVEEAFLLDFFGTDYADYREK